MRLGSPPSSAPRAESVVVVPVTVAGPAAAAVATVGVALLIVTDAVPLTEPLVALTVAEPSEPGGI